MISLLRLSYVRVESSKIFSFGVEFSMASGTLEGFQRMSKRVYKYDPADGNGQRVDANQKMPVSASDGSPSTILIFGWADANIRHLAKFTDGYRRLFPSAKIVLVTAETMETFFGSQKTAQSHVRSTMSEVFDHKDGSGKVLIHVFSNSGGINLEAAYLTYHELHSTSEPLPATGVIFDSTPGGKFFWKEFPRWSRGVYAGLAPVVPLPGFITMAFAWTWVLLVMGMPMLLGYENTVSRVSRFVNDPRNIKDSGRLYLYSKVDPLIDWRNVEDAAAKATANGFDVHLARFEDSKHCAHMRMYPEKYWGAVREFWRMAVKGHIVANGE